MKVVIKRQNAKTSSSLFHSSTYYGQEFDDGIRHWKYIKREKLPDGKYRYWYDEYSYAKDVASKQKAFNQIPNQTVRNENVLRDPKNKGALLKENLKENMLRENVGGRHGGGSSEESVFNKIKSTLKTKMSDISTTVTKSVGSGEKWIYKNILNTKFGNTLATAIGKASEKVSSFLNLFSKDKKGPSVFDKAAQSKVSVRLDTVTKMALNQVKQQKMTTGANAVSKLMLAGGVAGNGAKRNANNPLKRLEDPKRISTYEPTKYESPELLKYPLRNSTYERQLESWSRHTDNNDPLERLENPMRTGTYQKQSGSGSRHAETIQRSSSRHAETVQGSGSRHEDSNQKTNTLARLADPRRSDSYQKQSGSGSGHVDPTSNVDIFRNTTLNRRISAIETPDSVKNIDIFGTSNKKSNVRRR